MSDTMIYVYIAGAIVTALSFSAWAGYRELFGYMFFEEIVIGITMTLVWPVLLLLLPCWIAHRIGKWAKENSVKRNAR